MEHNRNFSSIRLHHPRLLADPIVNATHDDLEVAYYKYWKLNQSYDFYGYNKKSTVEASKQQFDTLHGLLFVLYDIILHEQNIILPIDKRADPAKYNDIFDDDGIKIGQKDTEAKLKLRNNTPHFNNLVNIVKSKINNSKKLDGTNYTDSEKSSLLTIMDNIT